MSKWAVPWAFVVDVLLASAPSFDAARHHGGWITYVAYFLILGTLRSIDNWAVEKGWGIWRRIALKVPVLIGAEAIVLVSAMEVCDLAVKNCRRVFF